jgi:hypothetical protein
MKIVDPDEEDDYKRRELNGVYDRRGYRRVPDLCRAGQDADPGGS